MSWWRRRPWPCSAWRSSPESIAPPRCCEAVLLICNARPSGLHDEVFASHRQQLLCCQASGNHLVEGEAQALRCMQEHSCLSLRGGSCCVAHNRGLRKGRELEIAILSGQSTLPGRGSCQGSCRCSCERGGLSPALSFALLESIRCTMVSTRLLVWDHVFPIIEWGY